MANLSKADMQAVLDNFYRNAPTITSMQFRCQGDEVFIKTNDKEDLAYIHGEYHDGWDFEEHYLKSDDVPEGIGSMKELLNCYGY